MSLLLLGVLALILLLVREARAFDDLEERLRQLEESLSLHMLEIERRERLKVLFSDLRERMLSISDVSTLSRDLVEIAVEDMGYAAAALLDGSGGIGPFRAGDEELLEVALKALGEGGDRGGARLEGGEVSFEAIPVLYRGELVGRLLLVSYDPEAFDGAYQREALDLLLGTFAVALSNARYVERLKEMQFSIARALAQAVEAKDLYTRGHLERVEVLAETIALKAGLSEHSVERLKFAAVLHDVGKIAVPEQILNKPSALSEEEFSLIKKHPDEGYKIVSQIDGLEDVALWVRFHHERWDGSGYPLGLKGEEIPVEARVLSLADSIDAMISNRPYRRGLPFAEVAQELLRCAGSQFDPNLARIAARLLVEESEELKRGFARKGLKV